MRRPRIVKRSPTAWVSLLIVAAIGGLGIVAAATTSAHASPTAATPTGERVAVAADATEVTVGFYAATLQGLDQADNSYYADFFMWMRWTGDRDPTATFELTNNVERWGLTTARVYPKPITLDSGEKIQEYRVQGLFFQALDLSDYPLDTHTLRLTVEDTTYSEQDLVYVADTDESGIDPGVKMPGWNITGWDLPIVSHEYQTSFGEGSDDIEARRYSAASFEIDIERPRTFFLWKLLLPLIIVLLLAGSVLFIHPSLIEVRLAAPATALLSLVFLQQTYSDTLPATGTLVLLDQIYALAYLVVVALILTTTVTSYWVREEGPEATARAFRLDHIAAAAMLVLFVTCSLVLILIR